MLEWSDRLLDDRERACLRRLGVFGSGFTVRAAEAAAAADDVDAYDVPEMLWSLVDKSLVVADLAANETRYRLLESVQEFARRRLMEHGETDAAAVRLAALVPRPIWARLPAPPQVDQRRRVSRWTTCAPW